MSEDYCNLFVCLKFANYEKLVYGYFVVYIGGRFCAAKSEYFGENRFDFAEQVECNCVEFGQSCKSKV